MAVNRYIDRVTPGGRPLLTALHLHCLVRYNETLYKLSKNARSHAAHGDSEIVKELTRELILVETLDEPVHFFIAEFEDVTIIRPADEANHL